MTDPEWRPPLKALASGDDFEERRHAKGLVASSGDPPPFVAPAIDTDDEVTEEHFPSCAVERSGCTCRETHTIANRIEGSAQMLEMLAQAGTNGHGEEDTVPDDPAAVDDDAG